MVPLLTKPFVILGLCLVLGCTAENYRRDGDAATLSGRHDDAVRNYQAALAADPSLAQNPAFSAKFHQARIGASFDRGQLLSAQGAWERAIEPYLESLALDPDHIPAQQALATARRNAAAELHQKALKQADLGALDAAIEMLRRAVAIDPDNEQARDALRTALEQRVERQGQATELFSQAEALTKQRHWLEARVKLDQALKLDSNHVPARALLRQAHGQLQLAEAAGQRGAQFAADKKLDDAIGAFEESLMIWPSNDAARQQLDETRQVRARIVRLMADAQTSHAARRWPDAMRSLYAARELSPHNPGLLATIDETARAAAADLTAIGHAQLQRDQLTDAERSFRTAIEYAPNDAAIHAGLASVAGRRGTLAEREGLWGAAMLWHETAANHDPHGPHGQNAVAARERVFMLTRASLNLDASADDPRFAEHAPLLGDAVRAALQEAAAPHLHLNGHDAHEDHDHPHYTANVELASLAVTEQRVGSQQRQFAYTAYQTVPNPAIPKLHAELDLAMTEAAHLRSRIDLVCDICRGAGHVHCHACHGSRTISCDHCSGASFIIIQDRRTRCDPCAGRGWSRVACGACESKGRHHDHDCSACHGRGYTQLSCGHCSGSGVIIIVGGRRPCGHCSGRGHLACHACAGRGLLQCTRCSGLGRYSLASIHDLRRAEDRAAHLHRELRNAPETVEQPYTAHWPYTQHEHEKTGTLRATLSLRTVPGGTVLGRPIIEKSATHRDRVIDNPNPSIGLHEDHLSLPSDADVRRQIIASAARDAAQQILATVTAARREALLTQAHRADGQNRTAQALESRIAAALLLRGANPAASQAELDEARRRFMAPGPGH